MKKFFTATPSFFVSAAAALAALVTLAALAAAPAARAQSSQDIQNITKLTTFNTVSIVIAGDPQLTPLAHQAFQSHGRYVRVARDGTFTLTFTSVSPTQVRVDITNAAGALVASQTATGKDSRDALYRAADAAVRATGGGNGYFTSRLAFVGKTADGAAEIHTGDLFLNQVTRVTDQRSTVLTPRWSPDGAKLLYTSFFNSGFPDIFQLDLVAGRWTVFVNFRGTNMGARYSPDGTRVVMVLTGDNGAPNLYTTGPDGKGPGPNGQPARLTSTSDAKASPCFSPDGSRIVFAMEPGPQLYLINAAGGAPSRLGTGTGSYAAEPDWSRAKPNLIAFTTKQNGAFRVAVLDINTGKSRVITPKDATGAALAGDFIEPNWLPDGRHVVCTQRGPYARSLYILDTEENSSNRATKISSGYAEHPSVMAAP